MAAKCESLGSNILTSSKCGPCFIENKTNEATMFCVECNDMLCDTCVEIHKRFPTMKNHKIVVQTDKEQFEFTAQLLSDKCEKHDGKHLETFCKIHDDLCCSVCVSLNHRICDGLVYLPEFASETTTKDNSKDISTAIEQIKTHFENTKIRRQADKLRMDKEKADSSKRLNNYSKALIKDVDRIHANVYAELNLRYDQTVTLIYEDVKVCDDQITDLNKVLQGLNDVQNDEARSFIGAKRAERMMRLTEEKLGCVSRNVGKDSMVYRLKSILRNAILGINSFGQFERQTVCHQVNEEKATVSYDIKVGRMVTQYQFPKEAHVCSIQGIGLTKNGQIIISDWNNTNIKIFNQTMTQVQKVSLPHIPRDVCIIDDDFCISYKTEQKVEIASLSGTSPKAKQTIKIGTECRGVCYKNSELFVACGIRETAEVRVYSLGGKLKHIFDKDAKQKKMFSKPYYVNTNNVGSLVFVGDNDEGVLALKVDGTLVWKYNDKKILSGVWDIAVDENDDLYVCGYYSNNIVKMSSNFEKAEVVIDKLERPRAICYDDFSKRIIVVVGKCDAEMLHWYKVTKKIIQL